MKLLSLTEWDLEHRARAWDESKGTRLALTMSPYAHAIKLLLASLETINKAGLDGKELTDLTLFEKNGPDGNTVEIHAKVKHRLATPNPPAKGEGE